MPALIMHRLHSRQDDLPFLESFPLCLPRVFQQLRFAVVQSSRPSGLPTSYTQARLPQHDDNNSLAPHLALPLDAVIRFRLLLSSTLAFPGHFLPGKNAESLKLCEYRATPDEMLPQLSGRSGRSSELNRKPDELLPLLSERSEWSSSARSQPGWSCTWSTVLRLS